MSVATRERLLQLLPAIHRLRDGERGYPLRALLAVLDTQADALEGDIAWLYENWFVETCEEWVVPYIADLLGVRGLNPVGTRTYSQRAYVANVLGYRRRKGTAAMLEQLAQDLTDWPAHAVEFFQLLATTQHLNHLRPASTFTPDLRRDDLLGLLGGPFEATAHTVEVRRISSARGRYNLPDVGLFLFRLESDPIDFADAGSAADAGGAGFYRFSPLGNDLHLFNRRGVEDDVARLSTEEVVPGPLRRRAVFDDLQAFQAARATLGPKAPKDSLYFGTEPVLALSVGGTVLPVEALRICDLADWHRPPDVTPAPGTWPDGSVAVDPALGRIAFAQSVAPAEAPRVFFYQGSAGALGGGGYPRAPAVAAAAGSTPVTGGAAGLAARLAAPVFVPVADGEAQKRVDALRGARTGRAPEGGTYEPVADRLEELLARAGQGCIVEIGDSRTYALAQITVPDGSVLDVRAADGERPLISLAASTKVTLGRSSVLILDGLLLAGGALEVEQAGGAALLLRDSTLVPGLGLNPDGSPVTAGAASVDGPAAGGRFDLLLHRSIAGPLRLPGDDGYLFLEDSIVDAAGGGGEALSAAHASLARCTVFGESRIAVVDLASDSIFTAKVTAQRAQEGCVRFSFAPDGSRLPQPYRCQPAMALEAWSKMPGAKPDRDVVLARVVPSFTSTRFGDPGYAQLTAACADEVRRGASDGGSMGAWNFVEEPLREDNLRSSLDESLRFGLEAGIFYVT
ncbi:MAG TPA: hypothetical protein VFL36_16860 [Myxococcales bacterium]|nr:hypothetical protein [Myxococcales bacterium]